MRWFRDVQGLGLRVEVAGVFGFFLLSGISELAAVPFCYLVVGVALWRQGWIRGGSFFAGFRIAAGVVDEVAAAAAAASLHRQRHPSDSDELNSTAGCGKKGINLSLGTFSEVTWANHCYSKDGRAFKLKAIKFHGAPNSEQHRTRKIVSDSISAGEC